MASPISLDVRNIINSIFLNEDTVNVVIWDAPQMAFTPLNPHTSGSLKPPSPMETQLRKTPRYAKRTQGILVSIACWNIWKARDSDVFQDRPINTTSVVAQLAWSLGLCDVVCESNSQLVLYLIVQGQGKAPANSMSFDPEITKMERKKNKQATTKTLGKSSSSNYLSTDKPLVENNMAERGEGSRPPRRTLGDYAYQ
ncbi:hypothetical protein JHK82_022542 [Glycine max]|nr:hypothetical protein JHK82_022542 [Glycine max]